jgi:hypothetical protein
MKRIYPILLTLLTVFVALKAFAQGPNEPNEGSQFATTGTSGDYAFSWWGKAGRTYFIKESTDLQNWSYVPIIESGSSQVIEWGFSSNTSELFLRLEYTDIPTSDPYNTDFSGAGISAWDEIQNGIDPLSFTDTDDIGIPDSWQLYYFGHIGINPNAYVPWSNGQITNLQAYNDEWNPIDFYEGQLPTLTIVSGNNQLGPPGGFAPAPLIVEVTDSNGNEIEGAPITFTVTNGAGLVQVSSTAAASGSATAFTDESGDAAVYLKLSGSLSTGSQITVTTGTGSSFAQVVLSGSSDDGTGEYASPFVPSNVVGTVNQDGSETITWQNNDSQSPIYIYQQAGGTWSVTGTLAAGTNSYTVSSSAAGSTEIGNSYSAGGSTGGTGGGGSGGSGGGGSGGSGGGGSGGGGSGGSGGSGGGGSGSASDPGTDPFAPIPVINYAVIDMSGTTTDPSVAGVSQIALDDSNNISFGFNTGDPSSALNYLLYTWQGSEATLTQNIYLGSADFFSPDYGDLGVMYGDEVFVGPGISQVTPKGQCYGNTYCFAGPYDPTTGVTGPEPRTAILGTNSALTAMFPPNPPYIGDTYLGEFDLLTNDAEDYGYCGFAAGDIQASGTNPEIISGGGIIVTSGTMVTSGTTLFDPTVTTYGDGGSGLTVVNAIFQPYQMNAKGWAIGSGRFDEEVWNGSSLTTLDPMWQAIAINNVGQVVGTNEDGSDGYIWTDESAAWVSPLLSPGTSQLISGLIPKAFQSELGGIIPLDISGTNSNNNNVRILFQAGYQTDANGDSGFGTFLLTLTSGSASSVLQRVSVPSDYTPFGGSTTILNANGVIATIGTLTTFDEDGYSYASAPKALLLLPADITIWKQGDAGPPIDGVIAQSGTTLIVSLSGTSPAPYPLPSSQPVWKYRQLKRDGSFADWQQFGTGTKFNYTASTSGIFQIEAVFFGDDAHAVTYVRKRDEPNATDSLGRYNDIYRTGQPDYIGIADSAKQIGAREAAHSNLGSTAYAFSSTLQLYSGGPILKNGDNKCNAFVYHKASDGGEIVPLINGHYLTGQYPPVAFDWWDSNKYIPNWTRLPDSAFPQPGYVVCGPDGHATAVHRWGHCGILDYDGAWIQAGHNTVNKYPQLSTAQVKPYQPAGLRQYTGP